MPRDYEQIAAELSEITESAADSEELMSIMVGRLQECLPHFNWVGFYMLEQGRPDEDPMLVLGPYIGAETPHRRIPLNQGICGAAVSLGKTVVVDDVNADPRYLACSLETKSEIVAPIFVNGTVVGELDIDSHTSAAFTGVDRKLVEHCAALVGKCLERAA